MAVKVSICIPCYKQVEMLEKCIESVLIQDFTDYEIIVTDDTRDDLVENYLTAKKIEKLKYFRNPHQLGSPENWNESIAKATGEYIKILHHDDFFTHTYSLRKMLECLEQHPEKDAVFCATKVWNIRNNQMRLHSPSPGQIKRLNSEPEFLFYRNMIGAPSTLLLRNNFNLKFDAQLKWLVDLDFYIRYLNQYKEMLFTEEALICTIDGGVGQITQSVVNNKEIDIREHLIVLEKIQQGILNKKKLILFLDELFVRYNIRSLDELSQIYTPSSTLIALLKVVFEQQNKNKLFKKWRIWFYGSRLNNYIFKMEKY